MTSRLAIQHSTLPLVGHRALVPAGDQESLRHEDPPAPGEDAV